MISIRAFATAVVFLLAAAGCASDDPVGGRNATPAPTVEEGDDTATACTANADCDETAFCNKPVGECDGDGTCEPRPEICTMEVRPVCGCDGVTYSNACAAASAGRSIDYTGECRDEDGSGTSS